MAPVLLVCLVNVFNIFISSPFNFLGLQSMPAVYANLNRFGNIISRFVCSIICTLIRGYRCPGNGMI